MKPSDIDVKDSMTFVLSRPMYLVDPTIGSKPKNVLARRLRTLDGQTIGVLWNGRSQGNVILHDMIELLRAKFAIGQVVFRVKPHVGNAAPKEMLEELAELCDAVVAGVGDCGSCCPASVLDAISIERLGVPAAAIGVEKLMNWAGRGMAKVQGFPDFPLAILQGKGMLEGMVEGEDRKRFAAEAASQVESILLHGRVESVV